MRRIIKKYFSKILPKSIFFVTLPKSGTVYTWYTMCDLTRLKMPQFESLKGWDKYNNGRDFSCPVLYSCGDFNTQMLLPHKINKYVHGYAFGAHIQASYHNVCILEEAGINRITILLRDPRDAFISWVYHVNRLGPAARNYTSKTYHIPREYYQWPFKKQIEFQVRTVLPIFINWVEGWLDYYASSERKIDILFVMYDELKHSPVNYFKKIMKFNQIENVDYDKINAPEKGKMHFRKGENDQWKIDLSLEDQRLAGDLLQERLINAFRLAGEAHPNLVLSRSELKNNNNIAAAKLALAAIEQFPNSKTCYDVFFRALNAMGVNGSPEKDRIYTTLEHLLTEDYFKYRDQFVLTCKQLYQQIACNHAAA